MKVYLIADDVIYFPMNIDWFGGNQNYGWKVPQPYDTISMPIPPPENWHPYANFEYKTVSKRFNAVEIFEKQNGVLK